MDGLIGGSIYRYKAAGVDECEQRESEKWQGASFEQSTHSIFPLSC